jgi:hypothetical protein
MIYFLGQGYGVTLFPRTGGSALHRPRTKTRHGRAVIAYRERQPQFSADTFSREECSIVFNGIRDLEPVARLHNVRDRISAATVYSAPGVAPVPRAWEAASRCSSTLLSLGKRHHVICTIMLSIQFSTCQLTRVNYAL